MSDWEDYYEILGVPPDASQEEIRKARDDNARIYHADHMQDLPESALRRAEEERKKVDQAYHILGNPKRRKEYHAEWVRKKGVSESPSVSSRAPKPKPVVDPPYIRLDNVPASTVKTRSFIIRNEGGPYSEIWFSDPKSWVRIVSYSSLSDSDELPLRVEIKAEGEDWGKAYSETILVRLDEEETKVRIELRTKPEPVRQRACAKRRRIHKRSTTSQSGVSGVGRSPGQQGSSTVKRTLSLPSPLLIRLHRLPILLLTLVGLHLYPDTDTQIVGAVLVIAPPFIVLANRPLWVVAGSVGFIGGVVLLIYLSNLQLLHLLPDSSDVEINSPSSPIFRRLILA